MDRRQRKPLKVQARDDRVHINLSLTIGEARKIERASGGMMPARWCRWAVLKMADNVEKGDK